MISDPIADMFTRIRNGYLAQNEEVQVPYSKIKETIAKLLVSNGYLKDSQVDLMKQKIRKKKPKSQKEVRKIITLKLKYSNNRPAINQITRLSKPSLRVYSSAKKLSKVLGGLGIAIISTPKGIMTDKQARKKGLGGEVIGKVW